MSDNQIESIQSSAGLRNLYSLNLNSNKLDETSISTKFLSELTRMQYLYLTNNQIRSIEITANLTSLQHLTLGNNKLQSFRATNRLRNLQNLYLSDNQLVQVDKSTFDNMPSLNELRLDNNKLSNLNRDVFSELKYLQRLNLRNNSLSRVPDITNLVKLENIDMSNQNGQLTLIQNFTFARNLSEIDLLSSKISIDLTNNNIREYENRAFCSPYAYTIGSRSLNLRLDDLNKVQGGKFFL
jgi:Leucine-rich repeat (LRR) protein